MTKEDQIKKMMEEIEREVERHENLYNKALYGCAKVRVKCGSPSRPSLLKVKSYARIRAEHNRTKIAAQLILDLITRDFEYMHHTYWIERKIVYGDFAKYSAIGPVVVQAFALLVDEGYMEEYDFDCFIFPREPFEHLITD